MPGPSASAAVHDAVKSSAAGVIDWVSKQWPELTSDTPCRIERGESGPLNSYARTMLSPKDPILIRFRTPLDAAYGGRIEHVVLFGSRAGGEARQDFDYDVAVLREMMSFGTESAVIADIESEILYDTGAMINALPLPAGSLGERTGFMRELRHDGVEL